MWAKRQKTLTLLPSKLTSRKWQLTQLHNKEITVCGRSTRGGYYLALIIASWMAIATFLNLKELNSSLSLYYIFMCLWAASTVCFFCSQRIQHIKYILVQHTFPAGEQGCLNCKTLHKCAWTGARTQKVKFLRSIAAVLPYDQGTATIGGGCGEDWDLKFIVLAFNSFHNLFLCASDRKVRPSLILEWQILASERCDFVKYIVFLLTVIV